MDQVISQGHLILVLGLIQTLIKHNDKRGLGVQSVQVGLHLDGDGVPELLGLDNSEDFPPVAFENGLIPSHDFFLIEDLLFEVVSVLFDHDFVKVLLHLVELLVLDVSPNVFSSWLG